MEMLDNITIDYLNIAGRNISKFRVNAEKAPAIEPDNTVSISKDKIVFRDLPSGSIIRASCVHPNADYLMRINEERLDIWRNRWTNGLYAPINSLVTRYGDKIEEGVLVLGGQVMCPYFTYEKGLNGKCLQPRPQDCWLDIVKYICLLINKEQDI